MSSALFCGHCQQTIPVADDGSNPARCPRCQVELAPAGAGTAWWLSGGAPHPQPLSPEGRKELPPGQPLAHAMASRRPRPRCSYRSQPAWPQCRPARACKLQRRRRLRPAGSATDVGPWGGLAVALGLLSFGISWLPRLAIFGIALGCLGLLLALIGLLVLLLRREQGSAFPLTAAVVCLQALVLASVFTLRQDHPANQASDDGTPKPGEKAVKPPAHQDRAVKEVLDALKSPDLDNRRDALETLGNLAGSVVETVPVLVLVLSFPGVWAQEVKEVGFFPWHKFKIDRILLSPDGKRLAVSADNDLQLWDVDRSDFIGGFEGYHGPLSSWAFSPDGKQFAAACDEAVVVWSVEGRKRLASFKSGTGEWFGRIAFSPEGKTLAAASPAQR